VIVAIADTHTVIWYMYGDSRLSAAAKTFMENAYKAGNYVGVSSISLIEMVYLIEKRRIQTESFSLTGRELEEPDSLLVEVRIDLSIARALAKVDVNQIPDMPDRIVAATALHLNVPIISRDGKIQLSGLNTIW